MQYRSMLCSCLLNFRSDRFKTISSTECIVRSFEHNNFGSVSNSLERLAAASGCMFSIVHVQLILSIGQNYKNKGCFSCFLYKFTTETTFTNFTNTANDNTILK